MTHEAFLTTDYNAEMIEHIERHPGVRDRAIFVGSSEDIVPMSFGKDLPAMRDWVPKHFDFAGYIIGEHPGAFGSRDELRESLGYRPGRTGVHRYCRRFGRRRASHQAHPSELADGSPQLPELRMVVVAGPRIDPASLDAPAGVECAPSCRTSTATWQPAIWRSCKAASPPAWS